MKPSLVICHNSMHSKKQTFNVNPLLTNLYPAFYNYSARFPENHSSKILERQLQNNQLDEKYDFLKDQCPVWDFRKFRVDKASTQTVSEFD